MAQARLLNKAISLSEKVADLKDDSTRLLYTWIIPHTDDFGLIIKSARTIKATVVPMLSSTVEDIGFQLEDMEKVGLVTSVTVKGKEYYCVEGSEKYQTLKKDRNPQTILDYEMTKQTSENWKIGYNLAHGFQMEDIGIQMESEGKRREEKRSEVKRTEGKGTGNPKIVANATDDKSISGKDRCREVLREKGLL